MWTESIKRALGRPAFPVFLVALAVALSAPAWRAPFYGDDLVQAGKLLEGHPVKARGFFEEAHRFGPATMTLFDWFRPGLTRRVMEYGVLPWWTAEGAQQSFWRPLAAATHWLDYRLWPSRPVPMHLHNTIWFCAFLVAAWALYRGMDERAWVAGLAALLLALNQENWQALVWIAARNSLITAFFVALTLWLHHRHTQGRSRLWAVAAWASLAAGLLAGEGAVTAAAYLFSYALFFDRRPWKDRLISLVPFALIVIAWRGTYQALGFGVAQSGLYVDPGGEPLRYVRNLFEWGPILLLDVFTSPILGKYASLAPQIKPWAWGLGLAGLMALAAAFFPLLRKERAARCWAFGLVLTLIPACATTVPDDRITLYAALGFAPLAASFLAGVVDSRAWLPGERTRRLALQAAGILLLLLHVFLPLRWPVKRLTQLFRQAGPPATVAQVLRVEADQELILINPPDVMYLSYLPYFLLQDGAEWPAHIRILSSSLGGTVVRRTGMNTLCLVSQDGPLIPTQPRRIDLPLGAPLRHDLYKTRMIGTAFRAEALRFEPGDRTALPGMTVVIDRVDDRGHPTESTFSLEHALDDARYRWVFWDSTQGRYAPFTPLRLGEERRLPGALPIVLDFISTPSPCSPRAPSLRSGT
jgi:hypothetical protein